MRYATSIRNNIRPGLMATTVTTIINVKRTGKGFDLTISKSLKLLYGTVLTMRETEQIRGHQQEAPRKAGKQHHFQMIGKEDRRGHHARGPRDREPHEIILVPRFRLDIEPREAQSPASHEHESREPSQPAERLQRPEIHQERRPDAEGDQVRERIVFNPEAAGCPGKPCNFAVKYIEEAGNQDGDGGFLEMAVDGVHDPEKATEQVPGGEKIGNDVSPLVHLAVPETAPSPLSLSPLFYFSRHKTVSPP